MRTAVLTFLLLVSTAAAAPVDTVPTQLTPPQTLADVRATIDRALPRGSDRDIALAWFKERGVHCRDMRVTKPTDEHRLFEGRIPAGYGPLSVRDSNLNVWLFLEGKQVRAILVTEDK
jgi:hypothetical protein